MEPRQRIAAILKQWLEKTHAEGEAIHAADLTALGKIQESKAELRAPLAEAIAQWRAKNPDEADTHPFRDEVNQLLALETHHSELLAARKRRAQEKKSCWSKPFSICAASAPRTCKRRTGFSTSTPDLEPREPGVGWIHCKLLKSNMMQFKPCRHPPKSRPPKVLIKPPRVN